jgi:hypothetical protein
MDVMNGSAIVSLIYNGTCLKEFRCAKNEFIRHLDAEDDAA